MPFLAMSGASSAWDYGVEMTVSDGERNMSVYTAGERWVPTVDTDILTGEPDPKQLEHARIFSEIYQQVIRYFDGTDKMLPLSDVK